MEKFVIFGSGETGKHVLDALGSEHVSYFIDNKKFGQIQFGKEVLSLQQFINSRYNEKFIVASLSFKDEICLQLEENGISDYSVWSREVQEQFDNAYFTHRSLILHYYSNGEWSSYSLLRSLLNHDYSMYHAIAVYCYDESKEIITWLLRTCGIEGRISAYLIHGEGVEGTFMQIQDDIDCIITAVKRADNRICELSEGAESVAVIDLFDIVPFLPKLHCSGIKQYKDKYKGCRCFLIGNGPSLRVEDLDMLHKHGEITFGCNKIYLLFDKTAWRPDFLCVSDTAVFTHNEKEIMELEVPAKILALKLLQGHSHVIPLNPESNHYIQFTEELYGLNKPRFSSDISVQSFWGFTVMYDIMLQAAAYMGFNEIYLLGVDKTVSSSSAPQSIKHFCDNYFDKEELEHLMIDKETVNLSETVDLAYESAEDYSQKKGFRVFNATRGGALEVFERVSFDELF